MNDNFPMIFRNPHPQLVIPESFDLCFSYEEQVAFLAYHLEDALTRIAALESKVDTDAPA